MPGTSSSGGRNRKSQAEHALTGTGRKDRGTATTTTGDLQVPEPPKGQPTRPKGLRGYALAEWTRMVARLTDSKTLSTVDDAVLYQYCCLFAETEGISTARRTNAVLIQTLVKAIERIVAVAADRDPEAALVDVVAAIAQIVKLKQLDVKHTTQLRQGHMALRSYLVEFGMTPAARSRVKTEAAPAPADPFNEFDTPLPFDQAKH